MKIRDFIGRASLAVALVVVSGCFDSDRTTNATPSPFRVATFNMRTDCDKGEHAWTNRAPLVVKVIEDNGFDVVGAQELKTNQVAYLSRVLGTKGYVAVGRRRTFDSNYDTEGVYILFDSNRFECLESDTFQLSETPEVPGSKSWNTDCPRTCVWVRLKDRTCGSAFLVYNTHLDHMSELARRKGMELVISRMNSATADGTPAFLMGDFNCAPAEDNAVGIAKRAMRDAAVASESPHSGPEKTFTDWNPTAHFLIDYIFVKGTARVLSHTTHDDMPDGKLPSDHFPVSAEVLLK